MGSSAAPAVAREAAGLTERQQREQQYHARRAHGRQALADAPVSLGIALAPARRWWNAHWHLYTRLREMDLAQSRALVLGCGFGADAILISYLAGEVCACDLSPESVEIAQRRAAQFAKADTFIDVAPAEDLPYPDEHFDVVVCADVLHHVDIPQALSEMSRVAKPGALVAVDEVYTHSALERVRRTKVVDERLYPRLRSVIYGPGTPYITQDERKLDQRDIAILRTALEVEEERYFNAVTGRILSRNQRLAAQAETVAMGIAGPVGRLAGGRVVMLGRVRKAADRLVAEERRVQDSLAALSAPPEG